LLSSLLQEMERWLKVLLGTLFGSLGSIVFFLIFDRIVQTFRKAREKRGSTFNHQAIPMKVRLGKGEEKKAMQEEMENLVFEEFDTDKHEVLAICLETPTTAVGISLFLNDREIEFYREKFPDCCVRHQDGEDFIFRNLMTAVSFWGPKWTYAEAVNFLVSSGSLTKTISKGTTRQWRSVDQFEQRHSFRFFIQWTDNYVCDEVANEELWEELVVTAKKMLNSSDKELETAWDTFPVNHWKTTRVRVNGTNFHLVPHPGEVSKEVVVEKCATVTNDLVSI